ncbi:hypothetical protein Tcan_15773 [Toxocara canis]|uniref:aralkylamine N-acetyltransferase n=1 Tax=Toxocara canis TaxID=6265 RepID=A0A0B2V605_TOXCA|nr:hypothetical protein Tcan_15773 [Toxocara canis]
MIIANSSRILSAVSRLTIRSIAVDHAQQSVIYTRNESFIVEQAKPNDAGRIIDFLANVFTFTEPHCRALGMTSEESKPFIAMIAEKCLPYGLSCVVTEERSKQLAAVRLFGIIARDDSPQEPIQLPAKAQIIARLLDETKKGFWDMVDVSVRRVVAREITSVSKQHMHKGIATFLLSHLLDESNVRRLDVQGIISEASSIQNQRLLRKAGYEAYNEIKHSEYLDENGIISEASSIQNQRLLRKAGYEAYNEIKHSEYLDENGHRIFNCDDGTDRIVLFFKKL